MTNTIILPRSVVEQALTTLQMYGPSVTKFGLTFKHGQDAIEALRAALEQPVEQEPFTVLVRKRSWLKNTWEAAPCGFPDYGKAWADERINVYTHPQNLNCKSTQHRLATLWGYEKPQPPRQPLTDEAVLGVAKSIEIQFDSERLNEQIDDILAFARAIERAHGIGGEK